MTLNSCLYEGQVFHKRFRPRTHVLRYTVFSWLLDLAEIDQLSQKLWLLSRNRFNLFSFYDADFGQRSGEALDDYVARSLSEAGIHTMPTRILLSCYPRILGYTFNPLSLFYCFNEADQCFAVVHEVHNTFKERHAYVLAVKNTSLSPAHPRQWIHQKAEKELFVSPFAGMSMDYQFRLNTPGEKQVVVIRASDNQGTLITASYVATRRMLSASQLTKYFFKIPLLSAKVVAGIHWEALRLWVKGVPLFKHQPKRST